MSRLRVRPSLPNAEGVVLEVTPGSAGWDYVGFRLIKRHAGEAYSGREAARETCLVVISGRADITVGDQRFAGVGGRATPFEDAPPGAVYVPADVPYTVTARDEVELGVCTAPAGLRSAHLLPRHIMPEDMVREVRGSGTNTRFVRNILPENQPAQALLVVEVITPGGHWSSYPPHKHDAAEEGQETRLEETYYHRLNPPQGFAFQRVYTDDRRLDEAVLIEDGDVVMVPEGYHPVGAAHGYDLYYLNVMAGPERRWIFRNDPHHEWMLTPSPDLKA